MNDFNELNKETFGEGGNTPPYTPPYKPYVTYIPYGFTPKTFEESKQIKKIANLIGISVIVLSVIASVFPFLVTFVLNSIGISSEQAYNILNDGIFNQFSKL